MESTNIVSNFYNPAVNFSTHLRLLRLQKKTQCINSVNQTDEILKKLKLKYKSVSNQKEKAIIQWDNILTTNDYQPIVFDDEIVKKHHQNIQNQKLEEIKLNLENDEVYNVFENTIAAEIKKMNYENKNKSQTTIENLKSKIIKIKTKLIEDRINQKMIKNKEIVREKKLIGKTSGIIVKMLLQNEKELIEMIVDDLIVTEIELFNRLEEIQTNLVEIKQSQTNYNGDDENFGLFSEISKRLKKYENE